MAMQTYLATIGSQKVGFTVVDKQADGKPVYQGGVLGLLERNTMRYYLAIDAYLVGLHPAAGRAAGAAHPRVVREHGALRRAAARDGRDEYLDMKRKEMRRQQQG